MFCFNALVPKDYIFSITPSEKEFTSEKSILTNKEIPDAIDFDTVLEKGHSARKKADEKNLNSFVFENVDGSNSLYLFSYPVKYIDDDGNIRDKSLDIIEKNDSDAFITESSDIKTIFNYDLAEGIDISFYGNDLNFCPLFLENNNTKPILSDDSKSLLYDIDNDVCLDYSLTYQGVKENIIVNNYNGVNTFSFSLKTNGLHLNYNDVDEICFYNDKEESVGSIGQIITNDSSDKVIVGKAEFETIEENEKYIINISIDDDFLNCTETVYPLYIDPTINVDYSHCGPYGAYNEAGIVHSTIYSDNTCVHNSTIVTGKYNNTIARSLMRFPGLIDYNGVCFLSMDDSLINSAKVYLRDVGYQSDINAMNVYCHQYNMNWSNTSNLLWDTYANNYDNNILSYNCICHSNGITQNPMHTYAFDITSLAREWANGGQYWKNGIMFKADSIVEAGSTLYSSFGNYNSVYYAPYLIIDYETPYNYEYAKDVDISYTYHSSIMQLNAGETYIFETEKSSNYSDCDTELFLFKKDMSADSNDTWYNDDISTTTPINRYSRIEAQIQTSGEYVLMAKVYSGTGVTGVLPTGYCKVNSIDPVTNIKTTLKDNAKLGGYALSIPNDKTFSNTMYNSFTSNQSPINMDTMMYVLSGDTSSTKKVIGFNDDYLNISSSGDHEWGRASRVEQNYYTTHPTSIIVSTYSESVSGTSEVYAICEGKYSSTTFPNYKYDDSIISAPNTPYNTYNCIAYSGGITSYWINPDLSRLCYLSPWYDSNTETAYDAFYGNNPPRYNGATTYTLTSNSDEAIINVYKNGSEWTHASVKKPGNNQMHGYSWESKCGPSYRVFHELYSLDADGYHKYGHPVRYYKLSGSFASGDNVIDDDLTFEESIEHGLTTVLKVVPNKENVQFLKTLLNQIDVEKINVYDELYRSWINAINNNEEFDTLNDTYYYTLTDEYLNIESYIKDNPELIYLIIRNYLQGETDVYNEMLFNNIIVNRNDFTITLANNIRITNNKISQNSIKEDKYIAPTIEANIRTFSISLLNDEALNNLEMK